jgi:hypothetical protein
MINPSDIEKLDTKEGQAQLNAEFVSEMTNGKDDKPEVADGKEDN